MENIVHECVKNNNRKDSDNKMMIKSRKKNLTILLVMLMIGMTGCGNSKKEPEVQNTAITATEEPVNQMVDKKELPEESHGTINEGVYTATQGALQMKVPENWRVSKEDATILIAGKEEDTKDCVTIHVAEKDSGFGDYKQEDFEKAYNGLFDNLEFEEFQQTKVGNLDAIYMKYTCSKDSTDITEYQYMLDGEQSYLISFTDVSGELAKEIEACMESIVICR